MSRPFFLKNGADRKRRVSSSTSDTDENSNFSQSARNHDLEFENASDSEAISWRNLGDIDGSQSSSTPRSLSPLSSLSGGDGYLPSRAADFLDEPFSVPRYIRSPSPSLRPSTSLLEVSIASLPPGSELKQCLVKIREQMAQSLVRLKELEEQVKNVPTLQVRISVLQEEKRHLIKQLQSRVIRKRTRSSSADYSLYNNMHSQGSKSDTENEADDDYSLLKKRLRVKLNSVGVGNDTVADVLCEGCTRNTPPVKRTSVKSVCVGTDNEASSASKARKGHDFTTATVQGINRYKVQTRSIGVGMMRSFTRDVGVGDAKPVLNTDHKGIQNSVVMKDFSCDAPCIFTKDATVTAEPLSDSVGTNTVFKMSDFLFDKEAVAGAAESLASKADASVQTSEQVSLVSIGVGVCTTDEEPVCAKCANRKSRAIVKTVDEIMANRIDISLCKSIGVGDTSLEDTLLCDRCSRLETRTIGVGENITCNDVALGDFSISDGYLCDRCYNLEVRSVGCGDGQARTQSIGVGEQNVDDVLFCDHCTNLKTRAVGIAERIQIVTSGTKDTKLKDVCRSTAQHKVQHPMEEAAAAADSMSVLESAIGRNHIFSDDRLKKPINHTQSMKHFTRTIGVGKCTVMDSFCRKCDNLRTRSIGVGNANVSANVICDRCANKKTRSVGISSDFIETRSLGVSECCITDNYCDRCTNVRTQSVAVGDCCVTDSYCERCFNVQMHSVGVGEFDVSVAEKAPVSETDLTHKDVKDKFVDANMNIKSSSVMSGYTLVSNTHFQRGRSSVPVKQGLIHSNEFDANESDGSADNDNPSSDSASQTSEVLDMSQPPDRIRITDEVVVACKLLNGHLYKGKEIGREQMISCMSTVENNWFRCVSSRGSDTDTVRGLLKIFKSQIHMLVETIVNLADGNGNNALHYAVSFRNWKLVEVLLETGLVNLNLPNKAGYSPVMMAALAGVTKEDDKHIAKKLLKAAGDINKHVEETGQTPLMLAVSRGRLEMVELFLESGANINAADDDGSTALMCACEHGHLNVAKRLLSDPDCDPSMEDGEGSTALSIAMERNFKDIALLIYGNVSFDPVGKPRKANGRLHASMIQFIAKRIHVTSADDTVARHAFLPENDVFVRDYTCRDHNNISL